MSLVASKLSELWQFLYTKVTWNLNFTKFPNLEISVNFWDGSPNCCIWSLNVYLYNMSIATWGLSPLHHWFLWGGFRSLPPPTHRSCTPSKVGLILPVLTLKWWNREEFEVKNLESHWVQNHPRLIEATARAKLFSARIMSKHVVAASNWAKRRHSVGKGVMSPWGEVPPGQWTFVKVPNIHYVTWCHNKLHTSKYKRSRLQ